MGLSTTNGYLAILGHALTLDVILAVPRVPLEPDFLWLRSVGNGINLRKKIAHIQAWFDVYGRNYQPDIWISRLIDPFLWNPIRMRSRVDIPLLPRLCWPQAPTPTKMATYEHLWNVAVQEELARRPAQNGLLNLFRLEFGTSVVCCKDWALTDFDIGAAMRVRIPLFSMPNDCKGFPPPYNQHQSWAIWISIVYAP